MRSRPLHRGLALLALLSAPALALQVGPDSADVELIDSDASDGPATGLLPTTGATSLGLADGGATSVALPFNFTFYGVAHDTVLVGNEGVLSFDTSLPAAACPGTGSAGAHVAAFWDDWAADAVSMAVVGRYPTRAVVLTWSGPHGTAGGDGTVQAWLREGEDTVMVVLDDVTFGDPTVDGGASAFVGAQGDASTGVAWSCSGGLRDGTAAWIGPTSVRPAASARPVAVLPAPWTGASASDWLGGALATGDTNGDGLGELLVGAPDRSVALLFTGSGAPGGTAAGATLSLSSTDSGDGLGAALALADLDGDGLDDLVLGAPESDLAAPAAGAVFVLGGTGQGATASLPADSDWTLTGPLSARRSSPATWVSPAAGSAVAVGDVDADGYGDLLVGAPDEDTVDTNAGAAFLVLGGASALGGTTTGLDSADAVVLGSLEGDHLGRSLALVDLDADGSAELILAAPDGDNSAGAGDAGQVFVLSGAGLSPGTWDAATTAVLTIEGSAADDALGTALATGDLDGDGSVDLVLGAPFSDATASVAGAAHAFLGAGALSGLLDATAAADLVVTGSDPGDFLGSAVAVGDLDDDGAEDLVLGAPGALGAATGAGVVGLLLAPTTAVAPTLDDLDRVVAGDTSGGALGTAVAVAPDHDDNGLDDAVFTAPYADSSADTQAGGVWWLAVAADFPDADGDGFVARSAGGVDCDDDDAAVSPAATELAATGVDEDCDGWIDGVAVLRTDEDHWDWDLEAELGTTDHDSFDIEDATAGDDLRTAYATSGLTLVPTDTITATVATAGAQPLGSLGATITDDGSDNGVALRFADDVDAVSFRLLDPDGDYIFSAEHGGSPVLVDTTLPLAGDDRPGGLFVGLSFATSIDTLAVLGPLTDGFGIDQIQVVWAAGTDRDGDGYSEDDGDCNDSDASISPAASEDLSNGIDDDCDGIVDGGSDTAYTDETLWSVDAGILPERVDFETPALAEAIDDEYLSLGLSVDATLTVVDDVDGSAPVDLQAGQATSTVTLVFKETQPAVALRVLDAAGDVSFTGSAGGVTLYEHSIDLAGDDVDEGVFVGFVFEYGIDQLEISSDTALDTWGIDSLVMSELGLDDADGDGYTEADGDCDDDSATTHPGAADAWYDGVDADCGGEDDYDSDGDGHRSLVYGGTDCDDASATVSPDATETWYDGIDQDCGGDDDYDSDGDGHSSALYGGTDCDDLVGTTNPDAVEIWYDGVDQDCGGDSDYDADGDGYGASGYGFGSLGGGDCDDSSASASPGGTETWYDGVDSDCGEDSDYDADGDGYDSAVYGGLDCNDFRADVNPDATTDACYDGVDQDCDGASDYDCDGDGYDIDTHFGGTDCDDTDPAINPYATELPRDGIDQDCDGALEFDDDGDGHDGVEDGGDDCDDSDPAISPSAAEIWYDGVDQDCDGASDDDADGDGHDAVAQGGDDCDDSTAAVSPSVVDHWYDGVDADCGGEDDYDADGDGHQVDFYGGDDCDDRDASVHPGATELWYDGVDQDCDGASDHDADADGYDIDTQPGGTDCDDKDAAISPGATELWYDGVDQDCDGASDDDADGDGHDAVSQGGDDCDDSAATVSPSAADFWYDGVDADCGGEDDYDADGDGYAVAFYGGLDCDDRDPSVSPAATERWYDGVDQDCDGADDYDADGDGGAVDVWGGSDCDDTDPDVGTHVARDGCGKGDQDCDGVVDEDCGGTGGDGTDGGSDGGTDGSGDSGADGGSGADGSGDSGTDGGSGADGTDGADGADGADGGSGVDGEGTDGADGEGTEGADGEGTDGADGEGTDGDPLDGWTRPEDPGGDPGKVGGCAVAPGAGGPGGLLGLVALLGLVGRRRRS